MWIPPAFSMTSYKERKDEDERGCGGRRRRGYRPRMNEEVEGVGEYELRSSLEGIAKGHVLEDAVGGHRDEA